ncbi:MAG TPA: hypothetical protein VFE31_16220 [Opitutaceae bacterium]|jgi:hypothetical protein|nr:hypothetical protein [Opitutaceae bacterium]
MNHEAMAEATLLELAVHRINQTLIGLKSARLAAERNAALRRWWFSARE